MVSDHISVYFIGCLLESYLQNVEQCKAVFYRAMVVSKVFFPVPADDTETVIRNILVNH